MAFYYRACNHSGLTFVADERTCVFVGDPSRVLTASPSSPDMFDDLVVFASREDPKFPTQFGMWAYRRGDANCWRIPGVTWRSWYPGRFAPDGTYVFSGKPGDSKQFPASGRGAYWIWDPSTQALRGPYEAGTTNIEGIASFQRAEDGAPWLPVFFIRTKPVTVGTRTLLKWARDGRWILGLERGAEHWIATPDEGATWYLVTKASSDLMPCLKTQTDGTAVVAWNGGDKGPSFLYSPTWPELQATVPAPPAPVPPLLGDVPPQQKYPRPIFFAPYDVYAKPTYGTSARPIGNVAFPWLDSITDTRPLPIIVGHDTFVDAEIDRTMYYYIHANGDDAHNGWQSAAAQWDVLKHKPERPVILYLDSRAWPAALPAWLPKDRAFLAVQAYPNAHETPNQFKMAMREMCSAAAKFGRPLVLTPCFYTRNGTLTIAHVRAMMPVYDALVHEFKIVGIMPFSDMRTGQGMAAHPELYDDAQRMFNAIPARPNRFTYWTPSDTETAKRALKDQVRYDISGFSPAQIETLHRLIDRYYDKVAA